MTHDWALLTGASSGIGLELAKLFAADHYNLALVARNETRLRQLAAELHAAHGIDTRVLVKDLASASAPGEISEALRDIPVAVLVNNAGFGLFGDFAGAALEPQLDLMQVNMAAVVQLTHRFVQPMLARRNGRILNVASVAAFLPGPRVSLYYASKAFVYSFSYALAVELEGSGVHVTALCPGATRTEFFDRAQMRVGSRRGMMEARAVAEIGYRGLMQGRRVVIPGLANRISAVLARSLPARLTTPVVKRIHRSL